MLPRNLRETILGSSWQRALREIALALVLALGAAAMFLLLFRLSMWLEFTGVFGEPETGVITVMTPTWWGQLWLVTLTVLIIVTLAFAIRAAAQGAGFLAVVALVGAVPFGTAIYRWTVDTYPNQLGATVGDPQLVHQFGYAYSHPLDLLVGLGTIIGVTVLGHLLARRDTWTRTIGTLLPALFGGPLLASYVQPSISTRFLDHMIMHRASASYLIEAFWHGTVLAVLAWMLLRGIQHMQGRYDANESV